MAAESTEAGASAQADLGFDVVGTYHQMLVDNPDLTKPVVAIKALIAMLESVRPSTAHETMDIMSSASERLRKSVRNPVPLAAGTNLFLWFTRQQLKEQSGDFAAVHKNLVKSGQLFAERAIDARYGVAEKGWRYCIRGSTILIHGASRAVLCLIERAQKERPGQFRVVYVKDNENPEESKQVLKQIRSWGVKTSAIDIDSVAYAMTSLEPRIDYVFLGGEVITQDGGVISRMGTCLIARTAKQCNINTYVCGETHKFSSFLPIGASTLGFKQQLHNFTTDEADESHQDLVDWTPAEYVTQIITEAGVHLPTYVAERILDTYGSFRP